MKKMVSLGLATLIMCSSVFAGDVSVNLDGEAVEFAGQEPVITEGRTLIPLRGVFEKLGYEISWDNNTKTAEFAKEGTIVKVTAGSGEFSVNGENIGLDVPAQIINGSMMLPLRAIGEATGLTVNWDGESKSVSLDSGSGNEAAETATEELTEITTEESTETTTEAVKILSDEEIKNHVDGYITYTKASSLAVTMLTNEDSITVLMYEAENAEDVYAVLYHAVEEEKMFLEKAEKLPVNEYTGDLIANLKGVINTSMDMHNLMIDVLTGNVNLSNEEKVKEDVQNAMKKYEDERYNFQLKLEEYGETYSEAMAEYDWDFDELTDEQAEEERAYQKEVGDMLEFALDIQIVDNEDSKSMAKKIRNAAEKVRSGLSELTPPDFAAADDDILIAGCDFLDEAADIYEKGDNIYEYLYVTSLFLAFDACAKTCAGDYYVSNYIG